MGLQKKIAMRCTKEQFEAIKDKIDEKFIYKNCYCYFDCKYYNSYLTNNYNDIFSISSTLTPDYCHDTEIHEEWNEKVFLEACGICENYKINKEEAEKKLNCKII